MTLTLKERMAGPEAGKKWGDGRELSKILRQGVGIDHAGLLPKN